MVRRVLAGIFGAVLFGILAPVLYLLLVGVPSLTTFAWVCGIAVIVGGVLGARYPRVFGFVFEMFMDA